MKTTSGGAPGLTTANPDLLAALLHAGLLDQMSDGVLCVDADGVIRYANAAQERMFGQDHGQLAGLHLSEFIDLPAAEGAALLADIRARLGRGESWRGEWPSRRREGAGFVHTVCVTALPVDGRDGLLCLYPARAAASHPASEPLARTEAFLESIVENIPNMIFVKDAETLRFVRFNRAGEELLGYSRDHLIGKSDYDFFPKEEADFFTGKDREVLSGGRLIDIPKEPVQTRHRGTRLLHTKKIPITDEDGKPRYLLGISEDITDREGAQRALHDSEARYKDLYENIPIMYFTLSAEGVVQSVNAFGARHLGYIEEELVGRPVLEVFHPEDRAEVAIHLQDCLTRHGGVANWQFRKVRKNGSILWVQEAVRVVVDSRGETVVLVACEDITERKHAERKLSEQTRILQSVLNSMADGVVVADETGRFVLFNPAAERILGIGPIEVPPSEWSQQYGIYDPNTLAMVPHPDLPLARALRGEPTDDTVLLIRNPAMPEGVMIRVSGRPLLDELGHLRGGLAVFHDITARLRFEMECQRLASRLIEVQEEERKRISGVLHDQLGQILYLARLDLASLETPDPGQRKVLSGVLRRLDEALHTVRGTALSLRPPLLDDLGLVTALETMIEDFQASSKIPVRFQCRDRSPTLDQAAETCLYRVLQEALTNVVRHARATAVTVTCAIGADSAELSVQDNGVGFNPAADLPGKGIGLLGMRERLGRLGGKLEVISSPGSGVTVRARLPLPVAPPPEPAP
jgi:PAS domain S-box-containing protein